MSARGSAGGAGAWLPYRIVDAFTDRPFSGNPAAVVLPAGGSGPGAAPVGERSESYAGQEVSRVGSTTAASTPPSFPEGAPDELLQDIAAEMNLSETAFPSAPAADGTRRLRWFTPTTEVSLCGHATLAAAHALLEEGSEAPLRFTSLSGALTVRRDDATGELVLDFPADPPAEAAPPKGLSGALGLPSGTPFAAGRRCGIVPVADEDVLAGLDPDLAALAEVRLPEGMLGVSVTAPGAGAGVDFASRFFGPWVGVPEDPVTGMAHTVLGPYWTVRLGKDRMEARQRSRRGGRLVVTIVGDRVDLAGRAVTVARGTLRVGGG